MVFVMVLLKKYGLLKNNIMDKQLIISLKSKLDSERIHQDSVQVWSWINQPTFSKNTKSLYIKIIRLFFEFHWNIGLKEVTTAHITLYLKNLGEVSHSTLNINRSCLSSLFDFLCRTGYLTFNPVKAVKSKKIQVHIDGKIIPVESIKRMFVFAGNERNLLILKCLYYLALRESELINLIPSNFYEIEEGRAKLTIKGKGNRIRTIHVPQHLWSDLKIFIKNNSIKKNEFIFSEEKSNHQNPLSRQMIFKIVKSVAKKAKVEPVPSPHWFRHSSSRHALDNGANIFEISKTLGHSSLSTTQIYLGNTTNKSNGDYLTDCPFY